MNLSLLKYIPSTDYLSVKIRAIFKLTRWREHVPHTIPLALCGALMAVQQNDTVVDWRLLAVIIANILTQSFAFIINDVEDAPDDALNPKKRAHNAISNGELSRREGMLLSAVTALIALALFAIGGMGAFLSGVLMVVLCYLYSAYPFRLKARPVTDVVSHALMLSALIIMTGYFSYSDEVGSAWLIFLAGFLFSAYGQFYNQIDDYEVDKEAGLRNTVVLLGKRGTQALMYGSLIGAAILAIVAISQGLFPAWLGVVGVIGVFVSSLFTWETDMRGNPAVGSGAVQKPALLVLNLIMLVWLAQSIGMMGG